jgi:hypothetical protein
MHLILEKRITIVLDSSHQRTRSATGTPVGGEADAKVANLRRNGVDTVSSTGPHNGQAKDTKPRVKQDADYISMSSPEVFVRSANQSSTPK